MLRILIFSIVENFFDNFFIYWTICAGDVCECVYLVYGKSSGACKSCIAFAGHEIFSLIYNYYNENFFDDF